MIFAYPNIKISIKKGFTGCIDKGFLFLIPYARGFFGLFDESIELQIKRFFCCFEEGQMYKLRPPRRMLVVADHCTGCRRCEMACSFAHTGYYGPELSRIRVNKDDGLGLDVPVVCRQCSAAQCIEVCPRGALYRNRITQSVALDRTLCLKCGLCIKACPFGAIHVDAEGYPLICDLCGGKPGCVEACPTGAIRFGRAGEAPQPPRFSQPGKTEPLRKQAACRANTAVQPSNQRR